MDAVATEGRSGGAAGGEMAIRWEGRLGGREAAREGEGGSLGEGEGWGWGGACGGGMRMRRRL